MTAQVKLPPWATPDVVARLGTVVDRVIAREVGRNIATVQGVRRALGIPPHRKHGMREKGRPRRQSRPFPPGFDTLLGTLPDTAIAKRLGIPLCRVRTRRLELNIPSNRRQWFTEDVYPQLGNESDASIAARYGVCREAVRQRRERFGIPAFSKPPRVAGADDLALLGSTYDLAAAEQLGIPPATVARLRQEHGIPRYRPTPDWLTTEVMARLGVESDLAIANSIGVWQSQVNSWRRRFHIPIAYSKFLKLR